MAVGRLREAGNFILGVIDPSVADSNFIARLARGLTQESIRPQCRSNQQGQIKRRHVDLPSAEQRSMRAHFHFPRCFAYATVNVPDKPKRMRALFRKSRDAAK